MLLSGKLSTIFIYSVIFLLFLIFGGYIRLYLISKMKLKTIIIISIVAFIIGEGLIIFLVMRV